MSIKTLVAVFGGALALVACSGEDDAPKTVAATEKAVDAAATAPVDETTAPANPVPSVDPGGVYPPVQTPPTLPDEPAATSPATSPPPR
ncbi:MAG: hypothetical protein Q8R45_12855 [Brevundimonas sp.]|uniref:hypothetical protein n=1 Tax=Brevundimonas sp. TaxID=1871086 RepID=UPI0027245F82|nr:hypothetical protein [Brevundimonas sp.]MDO9588163.1 hypothetical protein [Brevundimonas sp.]MDP3657836.1 hypothetical protein [Brevundimonas sp.]MDZ4108196.1 hypothetical protein [Brevundimonas sp.]